MYMLICEQTTFALKGYDVGVSFSRNVNVLNNNNIYFIHVYH